MFDDTGDYGFFKYFCKVFGTRITFPRIPPRSVDEWGYQMISGVVVKYLPTYFW